MFFVNWNFVLVHASIAGYTFLEIQWHKILFCTYALPPEKHKFPFLFSLIVNFNKKVRVKEFSTLTKLYITRLESDSFSAISCRHINGFQNFNHLSRLFTFDNWFFIPFNCTDPCSNFPVIGRFLVIKNFRPLLP